MPSEFIGLADANELAQGRQDFGSVDKKSWEIA